MLSGLERAWVRGEFPPRWAPWAVFALAATPPVAMVGYAYGRRYAALVALALAWRARAWGRRSGARRWVGLSLETLAVCVTLSVAAELDHAWNHDPAVGALFGAFLGLLRSVVVMPAIVPAFLALEFSAAAPNVPGARDLGARWYVAGAFVSLSGALTSVFADEPILPVTAGVAMAGVAVALGERLMERRLTRWLREVAADRVPGWSMIAREGEADLIERPAPAGAYRDEPSMGALRLTVAATRDAEGRVHLPAPTKRGRRRAAEYAGAAMVFLAAMTATHGWLEHDDGAHLSLFRAFIVEGEPPPAVRARVPGRRMFRRVVEPRVAGVTLWRECTAESCMGVTTAVDERGRALDVPEVMARVRDRSLLEQVEVRNALLGREGRRRHVVGRGAAARGSGRATRRTITRRCTTSRRASGSTPTLDPASTATRGDCARSRPRGRCARWARANSPSRSRSSPARRSPCSRW
ncbi:MAG: hypothetical protein R3A52_04675 [Polyangiales bacterium]